MPVHRGVLVCDEAAGSVGILTRELMSPGRRLADDLAEPLAFPLFGEDLREAGKEAILLGPDRVFLAEGASSWGSPPGQLVDIVLEACQQVQPSIILFGHTDLGRDVAPRVGARLEASVCLDCIALAVDPETRALLQHKPVFGGNAVAAWSSPVERPRVATLRPRAFPAAESDASRTGEVIPIRIGADRPKAAEKLLETVREEARGMKLEEAKVIVAGGGGIGGAEGFRLLEDLAATLRGAVGTTRVPKDEGWMPASLEIGQTGHVVNPGLYIAVGLSGAPQHMAGCSGSKVIVAINKDPEARIFQEADSGIIGDYRDILPPLIEELKSLRSSE